MKKVLRAFFLLTTIFFTYTAFTQEALKSTEEEYYDFLRLTGEVTRPTLGYRTLSDSQWEIPKDSDYLWKENNLGTMRTLYASKNKDLNFFTKGIEKSVKFKIFGPEWFNSYNTAAPYGQNDGALWQGKGYNTSFTTGVRLEAYGFEATFKPQISWTENKVFDYIAPNSDYNEIGQAATYGYYGVHFIDAPQRFGNSSFATYNWGDTEIRYTWHTLTIGFGTQSIWLGPAQLNPIIHSNNAAPYPKVDFGFRKTQVNMPYFGWDLGKFEFRGWYGKLTESDYFDNNDSNNNNLIAGLSAAWALPGVFEGITIGINRTMLSKWNNINKYSLFRIYSTDSNGGSDKSDQRFSLTFDYLLPTSNLDIYFEVARNDFSPTFDHILRYPFHTMAWTLGGKKLFSITDSITLEILTEVTFLECSADYHNFGDNGPSTFYAHHEIRQGYTNRGQWLGAGIGTGGNSQYLGFKFYYPKGSTNIFVQRVNPDLDYTMFIDKNDPNKDNYAVETSIRVQLSGGIKQEYFVTKHLRISGAFVYIREMNPLNDIRTLPLRNNFNLQLGMKYNF